MAGLGSVVLGGCKTIPVMSPKNNNLSQIEQYFSSLGFEQGPAGSLLTGSTYNGGLRYDDVMIPITHKMWRIQPCARVEDIAKKGQFGVLPYFTIFIAEKPIGTKGDMLREGLTYLTSTAGLSGNKLSVTTTELAQPYFPMLNAFGITKDQIHLRPLAEAMAMGDGSGWFNPPGHPQQPDYPSLSIAYRGLEICEVLLPEGPRSSAAYEGFGLGLERLHYAQTGEMESWNTSCEKLLAAIKSEAQRNHIPLPPAYAEFAATITSNT